MPNHDTQYIVVGTADQDKIESGYPALCLLTRRVFKTHEEAKAFIGDPSPGRHRAGQVVECYFPVPDSLYRGDWVEVSRCAERETIDRAQSAGVVALGEEAASGHTLAEQIEMPVSQRENARNAAAAHQKELESVRAEFIQACTGDMPQMAADLEEMRKQRDEARMDYEGRKASEEAAVAEANRLLEELKTLGSACDKLRERDVRLAREAVAYKAEAEELRAALEDLLSDPDGSRARSRAKTALAKGGQR